MEQNKTASKFKREEFVKVKIGDNPNSNLVAKIIDIKYEKAVFGFIYKVLIYCSFSENHRQGEVLFLVEEKIHRLSLIEERLFCERCNTFKDFIEVSDGVMIRKSSIISFEIADEDTLEENEADEALFIFTNNPQGEVMFVLKNQECANFLRNIPASLLGKEFLAILNKYEK